MLFSLAQQHIASTLVWSVVWPYLTLGVSSRDFIAMPRKTASENSYKIGA
jgi:hypothetical protein